MSLKGLLAALLLLVMGVQAAEAQGVRSAAAKKPTVSVYEMKDLANTGQAEAFVTMVETAITQTNRFHVQAAKFAVLTAAQNNCNSGMTTCRTPGKTGGFEGADFLIYGTITQGQNSSSVNTGCKVGAILAGLGGASCQKNKSSLGIDIRIVDAQTGELRWAKTVRQDQSGHTMLMGTSQVDSVSLFRDAAKNIATGLTLALYPAKIAAVQPDGTFMINFGSSVLTVGDFMQVMGKSAGCTAVDPDTGECLTDEGSALGVIQIYEANDKFSRGRAVGPLTAVPAPGAVVRPIDPPAPPKKGKK